MKVSNLNSLFLWKSLPWNQINERIFTLQEKIYKFSKQCEQKKVHQLQDCLLNSSDAKLLAIQQVVDNITQYYLDYNHDKYYINDLEKLFIYDSLFIYNKKSKKNEIILEYVKQYLVYLCLKPEWEARFEPTFKFSINSTRQVYFIYRLCNFLSKNYKFKSAKIYNYFISNTIINKYIDRSYLINKIQCLPSISCYLDFWLNNQYLIESLNFNSNINNHNKLNELFHNIVYNGLQWYNMYSFQDKLKSYNLFKYFHLIFNSNNIFYILLKDNNHKKILFNNIWSIYKSIGLYNLNILFLNNYIIPQLNKIFNIYNYYFISQRNENKLYNYINNLSVKIKPSIYNNFLWYMKKNLYHYDSLDRLRPNIHMDLHQIFSFINNEIIYLYEYYYPLINLKNIHLLFKLLNNMYIIWLKKNYHNISLFYLNKKYLENKLLFII